MIKEGEGGREEKGKGGEKMSGEEEEGKREMKRENER